MDESGSGLKRKLQVGEVEEELERMRKRHKLDDEGHQQLEQQLKQQMEQQLEKLKKKREDRNEAARALVTRREDPKDLYKFYEEAPGGVKMALKDLVSSEWNTLSREVQEMFSGVLNLYPINLPVSREAFSAPFQGQGPRRLYEALNNIHLNTHYARVAGLFQSSGWGKSRLVMELHRQNVWVVYLSLGTGSCFPERSLFADEFEETLREKISNGGLTAEVDCMNYCLAFWISCIRVLGELVPSSSYKEFSVMMTADRGKDFWPRLKALMNNEAFRNTLLPSVSPNDPNDRLKFLDSWDQAASAIFVSKTSTHLRKLGSTESSSLKFLFVIDEARQLLPYQGQSPDEQKTSHQRGLSENLYIPLRRSTRATERCMVLLMDTTSRVANFVGPEWKDPSARHRTPSSGFCLAPPLIGFFEGDVGAKQEEILRSRVDGANQDKTFRDIVDPHAMVKFGRPLWWSLYQASLPKGREEGRKGALAQVQDLAFLKLTGTGSPNHCESDEALISIVCSRCGVYVDPSSHLVSELVASHAMTVLYVSADRNRVYAAWPVEPLLTESGFKAMQRIKTIKAKGYRYLYEPILRRYSEGLLSVGDLGEFIWRIIFLEAFDNVRGKKDRAWITLGELLEELFGPEKVKELKRSAAHYQKRKLKEVLDSKLLVNAFHRVYKSSSELSAEDLKYAFEGRFGIVVAAGTRGVDFFLGAHLGDLGDPLNLTIFHMQVKNSDKVSPQFSGIKTVPAGVPYVSLFLNLKGAKEVKLMQPHTVWESSTPKVQGEEQQQLITPKEKGKEQQQRAKETKLKSKTCKGEKKQVAKERKLEGEKIKADWSDQIIVKARGLDAFKLHGDLRAVLDDLMSIQLIPGAMHQRKPSDLTPPVNERLDLIDQNWELQRVMINGMFGARNVAKLVWKT